MLSHPSTGESKNDSKGEVPVDRPWSLGFSIVPRSMHESGALLWGFGKKNACSVFALWLVAYERDLLYFLSQGTGWGNRTYARYKLEHLCQRPISRLFHSTLASSVAGITSTSRGELSQSLWSARVDARRERKTTKQHGDRLCFFSVCSSNFAGTACEGKRYQRLLTWRKW